MFIPFALLIAIVFFIIQLLLCFKATNKWSKLSILLVGIVAEVILWLCFLASPDPMMDRGLAFSAYILAVIGILWIAVLLLAWCVYGICCLARKMGRKERK